MKSKAIILDIDGVCLQTDFILDEILKLGLKGEDKWDYFYKNCNSDRVKVIEETRKLIFLCGDVYFPIYVIISTARNEKYREATKTKLDNSLIFPSRMYMRSEHDLRPACEVKREHLIEIMKEFDVIAFIDDDLQNCEMAKDLGVLALRRV